VIYNALVEVRLRSGIADPAGATIEAALPALGFEGIRDVRMGKSIRMAVEAPDESSARDQVEQLCRRLLANPVIEEAEVSLTLA
jgi:phosphoribosylformylglycinamidine synthase PurS subunit